MKNKIADLRNHLFATLEALQDEEKPMDLDRARAIAEVGSVIVESAKAEVMFLRATDNVQGSGFFPEDMQTITGAQQPRIGDSGGKP